MLSLSSYLIFISKNPEEIVQGSRVRAPSQKHMPQPDFWELLVACVSAPDTGRVNEKTTLSLLLQLCRLGSQPTLGTAETTQLWARGTGGHANKETQPLGWCGPTMSATGKLHVPARADNSKAQVDLSSICTRVPGLLAFLMLKCLSVSTVTSSGRPLCLVTLL